MCSNTTITEVSVCPVKYELYDANVMEALLRDTQHFSRKELTKLSLYKKSRNHGTKTQVVYEYGKGCEKHKLGRLYVKHSLGLQAFPFDMRNPLLEKYYWDVDMENCHYTLLYKLSEDWGLKNDAIRQYITDRDAELARVSSNRGLAKTAFLKIAYGGNIRLYNEHYNDEGLPHDADLSLVRRVEKEMSVIVDLCWTKYSQFQKLVKDKPHPKFSLFALILQTEERKCLQAMDSFMDSKGRYVGIYIHDGGEVEKLPGENEFPDDLLRGAESYINERLGYAVRLVVKPFKHNFAAPDAPQCVEVGAGVVVDDSYAAREFAKVMGPRLVLDKGRVWVFEEGLWSPDATQLKRVVTNCEEKLVFKQGDGPLLNYSGCVKKTACLMDKLPDVLPRRDGYFDERIHTDIGKVLFPNGVYNFKTRVFSPEFDPTIVFTGRMPRPFPIKDQAVVDEIRRVSFLEAFESADNRNALLHSLMRGFIGDVLRKKFIIGTGWGNSGKGMLATLLRTCMGGLSSDFNGNCLLYKSSQGESARDYGWMVANVRSRIAIGSEVMMKSSDKAPCIDGTLIKTISGGVDKIKMRGLYEKEGEFVNKATFFMFAQDIPNITPAEKTVLDRLITTEWSYSYVPNPVLPYERKWDTTLAHRYAEAGYGDAFFWLMVEEYEAWRNTGFAEPIMDAVLANRDNFVDVVDYKSVLEDGGFVFGDKEKFTVLKDLSPLFTCSKTMLGRNLTGLGLDKKQIKVCGRLETVYYGIERV